MLSPDAEGRCPECGSYGPKSPIRDRFFCESHGWFSREEADHIVRG